MRLLTAVPLVLGVASLAISIHFESGLMALVCAGPYAVIVFAAMATKSPKAQLVGATIGASIPVLAFEAFAVYELELKPGFKGDPNIGLGIILLYVMPLAVFVSTAVGCVAGDLLHRRRTEKPNPFLYATDSK